MEEVLFNITEKRYLSQLFHSESCEKILEQLFYRTPLHSCLPSQKFCARKNLYKVKRSSNIFKVTLLFHEA